MSDLLPDDVFEHAEPAPAPAAPAAPAEPAPRREEPADENPRRQETDRPHFRRLLSLSAQRRRPAAEERPADDRPATRPEAAGEGHRSGGRARGGNGRGERGNGHAARSGEDPFAAALRALSGIDDQAREAAQRASAEAVGEAAPHEAAAEPEAAVTVRRLVDAEPPRHEPRRPTRPLYTLQEVHERTGIPYATLALYAARDADRVPWLGERRSPAYARAGLEEFCRIHAEANPGWQPPPLGLERGWDDEPGLAARLDALAAVQERLSSELTLVLAEVRRSWRGEALWAD
jgi:hypothetical protein